MKKVFHNTVLFALLLPALAPAQEQSFAPEKIRQPWPMLQLSAGIVYSSIDLSRYVSSVFYQGYHARVVTHIKGMFFLSAEYSTFPIHDSPPAWKEVSTHKFDLNTHVSFGTNNNLTRIFVLAGANRHEWTATRTGFTDIKQLADGIPEGTVVNVDRWGINFGCGFSQTLYENIGVFADYRFCFGNARNFERVRIMDVMTTIGFNYTILQPQRSNSKKTFGIGNKLYKWTKKGARQ